jgi:hypothetical protein
MGKYVFEFGDSKVKDKLTLYAGYSHIQKAHSDYTTGEAEGNYPLDVGININNSAVYNMEWVGARYAMASGWNFVAAFYHTTQNSWTIGVGPEGTNGIGCTGAGLLCAGDFYEASGVVDYVINKHYDVYGGVNYSEVTDGLASGFPGTPVGQCHHGQRKRGHRHGWLPGEILTPASRRANGWSARTALVRPRGLSRAAELLRGTGCSRRRRVLRAE